jgi:hypothetical protein
VAEIESSLKVKRLERDIPKYLRAQEQWVSDLVRQHTMGEDQNAEGNTSFERESVEDIINIESKKAYSMPKGPGLDPVKDYQPVLYEVVKDPKAAAKDKEGLSSIQEGFIERTERLLQIFH